MPSRNIFLLISSFFLLLLSLASGSTNYAKLIHKNAYQYEKDLAYTFQITGKLIGDGDVKLLIEKNKIKGDAFGIGMTTQCDIKLYTNLEGVIENKKGNIKVTICGEGHPQNIPIPGKINFCGPLHGIIKNNKLSLTGKINIKGRLASFAGFKKKEEIVIEITDPNLAKTLNKLQVQEEELASL